VRLALIMETRRGTEESPRGLCEMSSSTRAVNEPKQKSNTMRKENKGKKRKERERRSRPKDSGSEVRVGNREGSDLCYNRKPLRNRGGKDIARDLQGSGEKGLWEGNNKNESGRKKKNQKKGKFTSCKNGLATKKGCDLVVRQDDQAHILLLGDLRWSGHREI